MNEAELSALSWVIGLGNPASALLVGPFLAWILRRLRCSPVVQRRAAIVGWLVLGVAQGAFLAFGLGSDLPGFKYAQPVMIPISLLNFTAGWFLIHRVRRSVGVQQDQSA